MDRKIIMRFMSIFSIIFTVIIIFIWNPDNISDNYNESNSSMLEQNKEEIKNIKKFEDEEVLFEENNKEIDVMINELSDEEKELFKVIVNKLSVTDISTIEKIIEKNNNHGTAEVLEFLEIRLAEDEYSRIDNIFIKKSDSIEEINVE